MCQLENQIPAPAVMPSLSITKTMVIRANTSLITDGPGMLHLWRTCLFKQLTSGELLWVESRHTICSHVHTSFFSAIGISRNQRNVLSRSNKRNRCVDASEAYFTLTSINVQVAVSRPGVAETIIPVAWDVTCIRTMHTTVPSIASGTNNLFLGHIY